MDSYNICEDKPIIEANGNTIVQFATKYLNKPFKTVLSDELASKSTYIKFLYEN